MHTHVVTVLAGMIACSPLMVHAVRLARGQARGLTRSLVLPPSVVAEPVAPAAVHAAALGIVAESAAMKRALAEARLYAPSLVRVILVGPTGSGKTLLAEYIHSQSERSGRLVVVTGAELPESLAEARLFGHVKGAFTDARESRTGLLTEAAGGTLFLDDMAGLPRGLQHKLLRVLDRGEYLPVGSTRPLQLECRVLFGLRADPDLLVAQGILLEDLRARMRECIIRLHPLAERREDIVPLARHFLARCPQATGVQPGPTQFATGVEALLEAQPWPRNVRQLSGVVERAYLHAQGAAAIEAEHLSEPFNIPPRFVAHGDLSQNLAAVRYALAVCAGRHGRAARVLGVGRNTVARYARRLA